MNLEGVKIEGCHLEWTTELIAESYSVDTTKLLVASGSKTNVTAFSFDESE